MGTIASPVTGAIVTGLTSPTYTLLPDTVAPGTSGIALYVSALGGTQTGVRGHTVSSPFAIAVYRPLSPKRLGNPNPATGKIPNIPSNTTGFTIQKGVQVAADQPYSIMYAKGSFSVPAGSETYDAVNVAACMSMFGGVANANADSLFTSVKTGTMT